MNKPTTEDLKKALKIAADALEIADDWAMTDIEIDTPKEWSADVSSCEDGWISTMALVEKLRSMAT